MTGLEIIDGGVIYNGKKMTVRQKRNGKMVLDVDGKKIRMSEERFTLMYTFFSMMFKSYSNELEKEKKGGNHD